jgi:hypothetical protein
LIDTEIPKRVSDEDELHLVIFMYFIQAPEYVIAMCINNENYSQGFWVGKHPNL